MSTEWYCVHTHGGKEFLANLHLSRQGFEVFVPVRIQTYSRRKHQYKPLFCNYLFVAFDMMRDKWQSVAYTYGVRRILSISPDRPVPISSRFVEGLRSRSTIIDSPTQGTTHLIDVGCSVHVLRGPFAGYVGICQWSDERRVGLLIDILHSGLEVEFSVNDVELNGDGPARVAA